MRFQYSSRPSGSRCPAENAQIRSSSFFLGTSTPRTGRNKSIQGIKEKVLSTAGGENCRFPAAPSLLHRVPCAPQCGTRIQVSDGFRAQLAPGELPSQLISHLQLVRASSPLHLTSSWPFRGTDGTLPPGTPNSLMATSSRLTLSAASVPPSSEMAWVKWRRMTISPRTRRKRSHLKALNMA